MSVELRCDGRLHGILRDGKLEVKCSSVHCGHNDRTAVFHYFDPVTGEELYTQRYKTAEAAMSRDRKKERI